MTPKKLEKDTEIKILEAAKKVFILKGLDGARMQEIADEAGINKALLHYYFRSKDQLFAMIFKVEIGNFFPRLIPVLLSNDMGFDEKIRHFVESYIDLFLKNPFLPTFIIREINRNPQMVAQFFKEAGIESSNFKLIIAGFAAELGMNPKEAFHLIINTVSACIFPFAGRPIIEQVFFDGNADDYNLFLEERKKFVAEFVISSIKGRMINNV
jgi:AcrR family transcriptional regulator